MIKTLLYGKQGCIKMCNMWKRLLLVSRGQQIGNSCFYTNLTFFKIENCSALFKRYLHENKALHTSPFYMKLNHFNIAFHMTCDKWQSCRPSGPVQKHCLCRLGTFQENVFLTSYVSLKLEKWFLQISWKLIRKESLKNTCVHLFTKLQSDDRE